MKSMTTPPIPEADAEPDDVPNRSGMYVSALILGLFLLMLGADWLAPSYWTTLLVELAGVCLISVVIWQACDPFADAAQWIGEQFRLPGSVRGATLDAVASSMPELFSGIFFVWVAISTAGAAKEEVIAAATEGYGSTIAICAGSAVYNMILIPAFCAMVIAFTRKARPTIDVENEVISRDGLWFVGCEMLLILFLFQDAMAWWMGAIFLVLYLAYIVQLYLDAKRYRRKMAAIRSHLESEAIDLEVEAVVASLGASGVRVSRALVLKAQEDASARLVATEEEPPPKTAGVLFGYFAVPLNHLTTWLVIAAATCVAAAACYFLVETTLQMADHLQVPTFFVAVIIAAAASSVPDTFLAIGAARRGDDSGAVSNAFGSNIFNICIGLSIPLFVNSYLTNWEPVSLLLDGKPMAGLVGLCTLLVILTIVTLAIMWHNRQLTFQKAVGLSTLYLAFIAYAVLGSLGIGF